MKTQSRHRGQQIKYKIHPYIERSRVTNQLMFINETYSTGQTRFSTKQRSSTI